MTLVTAALNRSITKVAFLHYAKVLLSSKVWLICEYCHESIARPVYSVTCCAHAQERLHNFFNTRKPKDLKKRKMGPGCSETIKSEASFDLDQPQGMLQGQGSSAAPGQSLH